MGEIRAFGPLRKLTGRAEQVILRFAAQIVSKALLASLFRLNFRGGGFGTDGQASPEGLE